MLDVASQSCLDVARHTAGLLEQLGSLGDLHNHMLLLLWRMSLPSSKVVKDQEVL